MRNKLIDKAREAVEQRDLDRAYDLVMSSLKEEDSSEELGDLLGKIAVSSKEEGLLENAIKLLEVQYDVTKDPGISKVICLWREELRSTDEIIIERLRDFLTESGPPLHFLPEKKGLGPEYLDVCLKLFRGNPDKNLVERANIYESFSKACQNLDIKKNSDKYLHVAFAIFLNKNYQPQLRGFIVEHFKEVLRNPQNLVTRNDNRKSKIDLWIDGFDERISLSAQNIKSLVEYVQDLGLQPDEARNYLPQLAKLWTKALWPSEKQMNSNPQVVIDIINKEELREYPSAFIPLAFDLLYFWDDRDKCAQHALTMSLDICSQHFMEVFDDFKKPETSQFVESYLIVVCPNSDCKHKVRIPYPCKEGIWKCKKCERKFEYFKGVFWEKPLPRIPEDVPDNIRKDAKKLLEKIVNICEKHSRGQYIFTKNHDDRDDEKKRQDAAIKEIANFSLCKKDSKLFLQVSIINSKKTCLYHIENDFVGKQFAEDLDLPHKKGEFIHSPFGQERQTVWYYKKIDPWNWYILVETHFYVRKMQDPEVEHVLKNDVLVKTMHDFILELEKQLDRDFRPSIAENFSHQVIQTLRHYFPKDPSGLQRNWIVSVVRKLFGNLKKEIRVLLQVAAIKDLADDRWSQTLFDVCTPGDSKATITRYLFHLLKAKIAEKKLTNGEILQVNKRLKPVLEMCKGNFFDREEVDNLTKELLTRDVVLAQIEIVASLLPSASPEARVFREFIKYQPNKGEFELKRRRICLMLLQSSTYKNANMRKAVQDQIRILLKEDVVNSPICPKDKAVNNLNVVRKLLHELAWR